MQQSSALVFQVAKPGCRWCGSGQIIAAQASSKFRFRVSGSDAQGPCAHRAFRFAASADRALPKHPCPLTHRRWPADGRAPQFPVRASALNIRFPQSESDSPPSNSGARPSEARTRPKNIRYIGPPRPERHPQTVNVDPLSLVRDGPRLEAGCQGSKISTSDCGRRLFEARVRPSEGRPRLLEGHVRAIDARERPFQGRAPAYRPRIPLASYDKALSSDARRHLAGWRCAYERRRPPAPRAFQLIAHA